MIYEGIQCGTGRALRVRVEDGLIFSVEEGSAAGQGRSTNEPPFMCTGFIDLQLNGYAGVDYSGPGLDSAKIEKVARAVAQSGTTRHLATIITGPRARIAANCAAIAAAAGENALLRSAVAGIHIEGPFISPEDGPRGAHDKSQVRKPDFDEFKEWQDSAEGMVRIVTLAPELEGALGFIEKVAATGVVVAIGHTAATPERIRDAVSAGARLSTHLGNGSHGSLPRLNNYLWEQMGEDRLYASAIADGFHLPDAVLRVLARAKGKDRLILVSDAASLAGSPPGRGAWGGIVVEIHPDGHLGLAGTEYLAGAGHLLDRCLARFAAATGTSVDKAAALCTVNPARLIGLPEGTVDFLPGRPASLVRFRLVPGEKAIRVETCLVAGEEMRRDGA